MAHRLISKLAKPDMIRFWTLFSLSPLLPTAEPAPLTEAIATAAAALTAASNSRTRNR
jgi:hypothetical protein